MMNYLGLPKYRNELESMWNNFWEGEFELFDTERLSDEQKIAFFDYVINFSRFESTGRTLLDHFLSEYSDSLSAHERTLINNRIAGVYGLFEVQSVISGQGMTLKDIFDNTEYHIKEISGSAKLVKWDVIACKIYIIGDYYEISGSIVFLPRQHVQKVEKMLLEEYKNYQTGGGSLDFKLFIQQNAYLVYQMQHQITSRPPTIVNKEGDLIQWWTVTYHILNRDELIGFLKKNSMFDDSDGSDEDEPESVYFTWLLKGMIARPLGYKAGKLKKPWSIFASITITDQQMILEVNSQWRKDVAVKYLSQHLRTELELISEENKDLQLSGSEDSVEFIQNESKQEQLRNDPAVRQALQEYMDRHYYEEWINTPIPALKGLTPVQACKEAPQELEELYKYIEQMEARRTNKEYSMDIQKLRQIVNKKANEG